MLPSEASVWRTSKKMEREGVVKPTRHVLDGLANGNLTYKNKKLYKLCKHCFDYKELDEFYDNARSLSGKTQVCKECLKTKIRIKRYGVLHSVFSLEEDEGVKSFPKYDIGENGMAIFKRGIDEQTKKQTAKE